MTALTAEQSGERTLTPAVDPGHEGSMAQVEVCVEAASQV
jgi:hypothetical protein